MDELRVLVIADDSLIRAGLVTLLESRGEFKVVSQGPGDTVLPG